MAPKSSTGNAKEQPATPSAKPTWRIIGSAIVFMGLAALASSVSQANLSPVFGAIPASIYHKNGITVTTLLAFMITTTSARKYLPSDIKMYIPIMAYYIPTIQWALFPFSLKLGAEIGPLVTEALTFYPLLFLACIATSDALSALDLSGYSTTIAEGAPPAASYIFFSMTEKAFAQMLPHVIGKTDFMTRSGLELLIGSVYSAFARTPYLLISIPAMLHTIFANPHHRSSFGVKVLNKTMAASNYTLIDRQDSLTGYISVLEDHNNNYRVLRCDHSVLGGDWLVTEDRKAQGQKHKESIYSVFTMLESVRLVEPAERKDENSNALFIGLGIGTSPAAFMKHGVNTTVVELDPVVHEFATKYFDLPTNHIAVLENAVGFVAKNSIEQPKQYDYIIHDVFTGGAEPTILFTLEFLQGLEKMLKDDGVIGINYAGDTKLPPPRIVMDTIHKVFPTCKIFREAPEDPENPTSFLNMVVFCTKSEDKPLSFRQAKESDWLESFNRREFIPPGWDLEIPLADIRGDAKTEILTMGNMEIIEKFHRTSAAHHWKLMRTVLPDAVWVNW